MQVSKKKADEDHSGGLKRKAKEYGRIFLREAAFVLKSPSDHPYYVSFDFIWSSFSREVLLTRNIAVVQQKDIACTTHTHTLLVLILLTSRVSYLT